MRDTAALLDRLWRASPPLTAVGARMLLAAAAGYALLFLLLLREALQGHSVV